MVNQFLYEPHELPEVFWMNKQGQMAIESFDKDFGRKLPAHSEMMEVRVLAYHDSRQLPLFTIDGSKQQHFVEYVQSGALEFTPMIPIHHHAVIKDDVKLHKAPVLLLQSFDGLLIGVLQILVDFVDLGFQKGCGCFDLLEMLRGWVQKTNVVIDQELILVISLERLAKTIDQFDLADVCKERIRVFTLNIFSVLPDCSPVTVQFLLFLQLCNDLSSVLECIKVVLVYLEVRDIFVHMLAQF